MGSYLDLALRTEMRIRPQRSSACYSVTWSMIDFAQAIASG
jgi:hypothetical protein